MSTDKRPNEFAARLQRIDEKNKAAGSAPPNQIRHDITYDRDGGPQSNALRNAVIWVIIAAGMGTGGYFAAKAAPPTLTATVSGILSSVPGFKTAPSTDAFALEGGAGAGDRGKSLQTPAVASNLPEPLVLSDLVTDLSLPDDTTTIGQIIPFDRNTECNLRRPLASEQVVNVRLENGSLPTPVGAISDSALLEQLTNNITNVTKNRRPYDWQAQVSGNLAGVDVFLTDTTAPIYLVVQNRGDGIIWNVHTAPGVTLAHVAIVSSSLSGLVSPPDDATFEALLVSDFVSPHEIGSDDTRRACMIRPWQEPQPDWVAVQKAERDSQYRSLIDTYTKGYAAYNAWFTGTLGVDASTNLVAVQNAAHVHFGPQPAQAIVYRGMAGRDVHLMRTDHIFSGDPVTLQATTDALHDGMLREAIGGDIALLTPDLVTRVRDPASDETAPPTRLPRNPLQFLRDRGALHDTFSTDALTPERIITITELTDMRDLLNAGEAMPDPSRLPLYAAARAPMRMIRYCNEVTAAFGISCNVTSTSTRILSDGRIEMSADLAYIPAAAPGDPRNVANGAFFTADIPLDGSDSLLPTFETDSRLAAMQKSQVICDALRADFGTCVVSRLRLVTEELWITDLERLPPGTNQQRLAASAVVTIYADKTWISDERLQDAVQLLVNAD